MPWANTFVFWGDERCVPFGNKDNNAYAAIHLLLDKVAVPLSNIYRIPVDFPPPIAAEAYERTLRNFFTTDEPSFDLILLGLGENGHTASLFPGTAIINESARWVKEVYVEEQAMYRISMTIPIINRSRNILFLAEGTGKAGILKKVLSDAEPDKYPAQLIKPVNGNLYWFVDAKAAALLPSGIQE